MRYRRVGGMAGLDQRLTVFSDGRVVLEDRKSRNRSEARATPAETERLAAAVDSVPAGLWHSRLGLLARHLLPNPHEAMRFELRSPRGWISGHAGRADAELGPLFAEVDELLGRAVREGRA